MSRQKKRFFRGNQHKAVSSNSRANSDKNEMESLQTTSEKKIADYLAVEDPMKENGQSKPLSGFRCFDIERVLDFFSQFPCQSCFSSTPNHFLYSEVKYGLASVITMTCKDCGSSKTLQTSSRKQRGCYEINDRMQVAVYAIGKNYASAAKFCSHMNMPPPVSVTNWNKSRKNIHLATSLCAENSFSRAAQEVKKYSPDTVESTIVSCDGTWQRRGFSSRNGIATVLSVDGKKVLDVEVLSNYCSLCTTQSNKLSKDAFDIWYKGHKINCKKNHTGSAGAMEPVGMERVFKRSVKKHNLQYLGYLGDGDSKSYNIVSKADPPIYQGETILKYECCGHVQKRMGRRLLDFVKSNKTTQYKHNGKSVKGLGGRGGLTKAKILRIQGHYGGAIRNNKGDLEGMTSHIMAIWKHRGGDHTGCGDWCPATHGDLERANKSRLPKYVLDSIKPIFKLLSEPSLLNKCLHGGTQNTNESFHNVIWTHCPKEVFVGIQRLQIGTHMAVCQFNDGNLSVVQLHEALGLKPGFYTIAAMREFDKIRIEDAKKKSSKSYKDKRKKKSLEEAERSEERCVVEGDVYIPGGF